MKKVKMLVDAVNDKYGFLKQNEVYELSNDTAKDFVKQGLASNADK